MLTRATHTHKRLFFSLALALLLAIAGTTAPAVLDAQLGTSLTTAASACHGGGDGGC